MSIEIYSDLTLEDIGFPRDGYYDEGVEQLKGSTLERYCQSKITRDFIEDKLAYVENPILLIQRDHNNTIRGFALLRSGDNALELVILCAAERRTSPLRSGSVPRGTDLLLLTKEIGKNYPQVILYALEGVVSLYHKFGFQLDGNPRYHGAIMEFYEFLRTEPSDEEIDEFLMASPIRQFGKQYYLNVNNHGIHSAVQEARENGFYMVWNPHATGGSKRKRKSKKNLKKRTKKNLKKRTKKKTLRRRKTKKSRKGGALNKQKAVRKKSPPKINFEGIRGEDLRPKQEETIYAELDLKKRPQKENEEDYIPVSNLNPPTIYSTVKGGALNKQKAVRKKSPPKINFEGIRGEDLRPKQEETIYAELDLKKRPQKENEEDYIPVSNLNPPNIYTTVKGTTTDGPFKN